MGNISYPLKVAASDSSKQLDQLSAPHNILLAIKPMKTIIELWNPKKSRPSDLNEELAELDDGEIASWESWSTAATKNIPEGSRFFMFRKGVHPKGIFAAGRTVGEPWEEYENQNWVAIDFTSMLDVDSGQLPISTEELLDDPILGAVKWDRLVSNGKTLTNAQADQLEKLWQKRLAKYGLKELS